MELGIRFSSPVLDEENVALLNDKFGDSTEEIVDVLESAPHEISVIVCLLNMLENKIEKMSD